MADYSFDIREIASDSTITVKLSNMPIFKIGLFFIKLGCWISGIGYEEKNATLD